MASARPWGHCYIIKFRGYIILWLWLTFACHELSIINNVICTGMPLYIGCYLDYPILAYVAHILYLNLVLELYIYLNLWITLNLCVDFLSMYFQVIMRSLAWWYNGRGRVALAGVVFCHGSLTTLLPYFFTCHSSNLLCLILFPLLYFVYFPLQTLSTFFHCYLTKESLYSKRFVIRMICFGHISNVPSCGRLL